MRNRKCELSISRSGKRKTFDRQNYEAILSIMKDVIARSGHKTYIASNVEYWSGVVAKDNDIPLAIVDADLNMPEDFAIRVRAFRHAAASPDWASITALMHAYPQHIRYDPNRPDALKFDAEAAGASEIIQHMLCRHRVYASDLAAEVLHDVDPVRNQMRLAVLSRLRASSC